MAAYMEPEITILHPGEDAESLDGTSWDGLDTRALRNNRASSNGDANGTSCNGDVNGNIDMELLAECTDNESSDPSSPIQPPTLTPGKEYHTMISYQASDKDWMIKILDYLEDPQYNFKCCVHDRDFLGGKGIIDNIEESMQQSMSIILIISPDHLSSALCDLESKMAVQMKHEREVNLIPVLRRGEEIPQFLRHITYIDARDGVDELLVMHKLARAIAEGLPEDPVLFNVNQGLYQRNGEEVVVEAVHGNSSVPMIYHFPALSWRELNGCRTLGLKMPEPWFKDVCALASVNPYCVYHFWYFTVMGRIITYVWYATLLGTLNGIFMQACYDHGRDLEEGGYGFREDALNQFCFSFVIVLLPILCVCVGVPIYMKLVHRSMLRKRNSLMFTLCAHTKDHNLLTLLDQKHRVPRVSLTHPPSS